MTIIQQRARCYLLMRETYKRELKTQEPDALPKQWQHCVFEADIGQLNYVIQTQRDERNCPCVCELENSFNEWLPFIHFKLLTYLRRMSTELSYKVG